MVHQPSQSGPLVYVPKSGPNAARFDMSKRRKERRKRSKALQTFLDIVVIVLVAGATYAMFKLTNVKPENQEVNNPSVVLQNQEPVGNDDEEKWLDLQPVLNSWVSTFTRSADVGVVVLDLDDSGRVLGAVNSETRFLTASLYKLFVAYEGYRRVENGQLGQDEPSYGSYSVSECLDLMLRESHSGCAENVMAKIGEDNLDYIVYNSFGLTDSSATGLYSTPSDMAEMMKIYFEHKDLSKESYEKILDSLLNQGKDSDGYDYRGGLPKGFTRGTKVYNKVGWEWNGVYWAIYNDAAILEFPEKNRHFAIVMMSSKFPTTDNISKLGDLVEEAILAYLEIE